MVTDEFRNVAMCGNRCKVRGLISVLKKCNFGRIAKRKRGGIAEEMQCRTCFEIQRISGASKWEGIFLKHKGDVQRVQSLSAEALLRGALIAAELLDFVSLGNQTRRLF